MSEIVFYKIVSVLAIICAFYLWAILQRTKKAFNDLTDAAAVFQKARTENSRLRGAVQKAEEKNARDKPISRDPEMYHLPKVFPEDPMHDIGIGDGCDE